MDPFAMFQSAVGFQMIFFVLAAIGIAVLAYYGHKAAKARREALALLASELGLTYTRAKDRSHDERYAHFEIFRRGSNRAAYNTLSGSITLAGHALHCDMGDFTYQTQEGSGKDRRTVTHSFSYCIVHLPHANTPDLLIRREGFFDKISDFFGYDDIDFESAEFSRKYFVKSPNKKFAYDICHPRMIEFMLETNPSSVDIENGRLCMTDGAMTWKPEGFRNTLGWIERFLSAWPSFVVEDLKEGTLR